MTIPPPAALSAEARSYLLQPDVISYPTDWTDPTAVQAFRSVAHPHWCGFNEHLDFDYDSEQDLLDGVIVERIRVGTPARGVALLHLHGGMYCAGNPEMDRVLNAPIARATGAEVVSVDYRLAPEHPFPAALDDAVAVYRFLTDSGLRVAVYGESAGGGLALATTVAARAAGLPTPVALALVSPMLDLAGGSDTYRTLAPVDPDYGDTSNLLAPALAYAGDTPVLHPLISPLFADLADLPPTLVQVGGREVLLGDSTRFAHMARAAGSEVRLEVLDGGWHNFPIWYTIPESRSALGRLSRFLAGGLHP